VAEARREVIWTLGARAELDEILTYIAQASFPAAQALLQEILDVADTLETLPHRGRVVPEVQDPSIRELFIKQYRLFYEVHEHEVFILGVIHGAREFKRKE
jgi:plasmid stabilization system protein ParE